MDSDRARCWHEICRLDHEACERALSVAEPFHGLHRSSQRNTSDVVEAFVKACEKRDVRPGLYYCSFDNHHLFGSVTVDHAGFPYDTVEQVHFIEKNGKAFTSSFYQDFQTNQVTELLTQYGPITEVWIDEPGVLESGYRTFLYEHIAGLQPEAVIVMNGSYGDTEKWDPWFTWHVVSDRD